MGGGEYLTCVSRRAAAAEDEPAAAAAALGEGTDDGVAAWGPAFALCCRQWTQPSPKTSMVAAHESRASDICCLHPFCLFF